MNSLTLCWKACCCLQARWFFQRWHTVRPVLAREIDALPDGFREVFVLRLVEEMPVAETAEVLGLSPQTVKSRLNRARSKIQHAIKAQITVASLQVFPFAGVHCDRITANTLALLKAAGIT